ncbi:hypothetical protein ACIGNX_27405 [Actinosynnema sp. NPDC053489]|uniref:hypothetical protein n=1 Tax=Actinosynnema sp. NPDC053489 TaxID=3363916 RepID=UPI0037C8D3EE
MSDQGKTYAGFIEAEVKAERERRAAFDARGQALITTSGVLVTLLTGVAALVKTASTPRFPVVVTATTGAALLLFAAAAACGVVAGWNRHYAVAAPRTLERMVADHWTDDEVNARNNVADLMVRTVETLRHSNAFKARWVATGLVVQVVALVVLGTAAVLTMAHV